MDETNPAFENFRNKMRAFGRPFRETTRRVSASKFLGKDDLEKRVEINARKITILKNIIQAQQIGIGEMIKSLSESSPVSAIEKDIEIIKESVESIKETLVKQQEFEVEQFRLTQRELERQKRRRKENLLEKTTGKLGSFLKTTTERIVNPVKNIFVGIIQFFATLFFGKFLVNFTKFLSNPKNLNIVISITDFIANNFDLIITTIGLGTLAIAAFSLRLLNIGGILQNILFGNLFGTPTARALGSRFGSSAATKGMPGAVSRGTRTGNYGGAPIGSRMRGFKLFSRGGLVPGTGNVDSVPAMLTPGEIVISKPAVEKIGAINLLNLNREAGKTNVPKVRSGRLYANEGAAVPDLRFTPSMMDRQYTTTSGSLKDGNLELSSRMMSLEETQNKLADVYKSMGMDILPGQFLPNVGAKVVDKASEISNQYSPGSFKNIMNQSGLSKEDVQFMINSQIAGTEEYHMQSVADSLNKIKPVSDPIIPSPPVEEDDGYDLTTLSNRLNVPAQENSQSAIVNDIVQGDLASPDESVLSTIGML